MARRRTCTLGSLLLIALALSASSAATASATDYQWSGNSTSSTNWSDTGNWSTPSAPSGTVGTLTFPDLPSDCAAPKACFISNNDTAGITADTLSLTNTSGDYTLTGTGITLNSHLDVAAGSGQPLIGMPLTLGGSNTWQIAGDLELLHALASTTNTLGVNLTGSSGFGSVLSITGDNEVGNVLFGGNDSSLSGLNAPENGIVSLFGSPANLNATNNNTIQLNQAAMTGAGSIGGLTSTGGDLQPGNRAGGPNPPGNFVFDGPLVLDSASAVEFTLKNGGATPSPGTDFGQIDAGSSNITLGGATLAIALNHSTCPTLTVGAVYTLMRTSGTVSGQFDGLPGGSTIATQAELGCRNRSALRIDYPSGGVTATVLANEPATKGKPTISGNLTQGQTLTESHAPWTNNPDHYEYTWFDCNTSGNICQTIAGAHAQTYTLQQSDVGKRIKVEELAGNAAGAPTAESDLTGVVQPPPAVPPVVTPSNQTPLIITGGSPAGSPAVTSAQLKALLLNGLVPTGKAGKIAALLKAGGYTLTFSAPEAGTVQVNWYYLPPGAHVARAHAKRAKPVLVASGRISFSGSGSGKLKIRLTKSGKRLLKHARRLKLTGRGSFTPSGASAVVAKKTFSVKR